MLGIWSNTYETAHVHAHAYAHAHAVLHCYKLVFIIVNTNLGIEAIAVTALSNYESSGK